MLPERPAALNPDFEREILVADAKREDRRPVHHQQICPNCSDTLVGHHCKLVCLQCGYYLSCAVYY